MVLVGEGSAGPQAEPRRGSSVEGGDRSHRPTNKLKRGAMGGELAVLIHVRILLYFKLLILNYKIFNCIAKICIVYEAELDIFIGNTSNNLRLHKFFNFSCSWLRNYKI